MRLNFISTFETMNKIYSMPKSMDRFSAFITELREGKKDDIILPIAGYNPMAGSELHSILRDLIKQNIEQFIENEIAKWNKEYVNVEEYKVAINLIDVNGGLWSQRYLTDYENRFQNQALLKRKIICIYLYANETLNQSLIKRRFWETIHRNNFQSINGLPILLNDFVTQEEYVQDQFKENNKISAIENEKEFIQKFGTSDLYNHIFYFFYGKETCDKLGYPNVF